MSYNVILCMKSFWRGRLRYKFEFTTAPTTLPFFRKSSAMYWIRVSDMQEDREYSTIDPTSLLRMQGTQKNCFQLIPSATFPCKNPAWYLLEANFRANVFPIEKHWRNPKLGCSYRGKFALARWSLLTELSDFLFFEAWSNYLKLWIWFFVLQKRLCRLKLSLWTTQGVWNGFRHSRVDSTCSLVARIPTYLLCQSSTPTNWQVCSIYTPESSPMLRIY